MMMKVNMKVFSITQILFTYLVAFVTFDSSYALKECTEEWRSILLAPEPPVPKIFDSVAKDKKKICTKLHEKTEKRGFLTHHDMERACDCLCDEVRSVDKCDPSEKKSDSIRGKNLLDWALDEDGAQIDEDIMDTWYILLKRMIPLLLAFVPLFIRVRFEFSFVAAISCFVGFLAIGLATDISTIQFIYLGSVCFACVIASGKIGVIPEVIGGLSVIGFFICVCFLTDDFVQLFVAIGVVATYFMWLYKTFVSRNPGAVSSTIVAVMTMVVMVEQIHELRVDYRLNTLGMHIFELVLNSVVPTGDSHWFARNGLKLSASTAHKIVDMYPDHRDNEISIFLLIGICELFAAFAVRSCFGMFVLISMKYKFSIDNVMSGFMIYMTDVFGGVIYLFRVIFSLERKDSKRVVYSIIGLVVITYEVIYAWDILMLRLVLLVIDRLVFQTNFGRVPKYLSMDMDSADFPQRDSLHWAFFDQLMDLSTSVVRITAKDSMKREQYSGQGFIRKEGRKYFLMSVKHVIDNMDAICFAGQTICNPRVYKYQTCANDSVCSLRVSDESKGSEVTLLDQNEMDQVSCLVFLTLTKDDRVKQCVISQFSFDRNGVLKCAINLSRGDSGSPVFALVGLDKIRYAGCVSSGSYDCVSGNWISSVVAYDDREGRMDDDSSDYSSDDGKDHRHVSFQNLSKTRAEKREFCKKINQEAQSWIDKCKGAWYVDQSNEGNEARYGNYEDFVDHVEERRKKKSYPRTHGKQRKAVSEEEFEAYAKSALDALGTVYHKVRSNASPSIAGMYVRDMRLMRQPNLYVDADAYTCKPSSKPTDIETEFEYPLPYGMS